MVPFETLGTVSCLHFTSNYGRIFSRFHTIHERDRQTSHDSKSRARQLDCSRAAKIVGLANLGPVPPVTPYNSPWTRCRANWGGGGESAGGSRAQAQGVGHLSCLAASATHGDYRSITHTELD